MARLLVGTYPVTRITLILCGLLILLFSYIKLMTGSTLNVGPGHNVKYQCILYIKHNRIRVSFYSNQEGNRKSEKDIERYCTNLAVI